MKMYFESNIANFYLAIVLIAVVIGSVLWHLTKPVRKELDKPQDPWQASSKRKLTEAEKENLRKNVFEGYEKGGYESDSPIGYAGVGYLGDEDLMKHAAPHKGGPQPRSYIGQHKVIPIKPVATKDRLQSTVDRVTMYEGSDHQKVDPAIMKQVLNEQFGELNPEPKASVNIVGFDVDFDAHIVEILLVSAGARRMKVDDAYVFVLDPANVEMLADRLNNL
jgi:hypothetical protein